MIALGLEESSEGNNNDSHTFVVTPMSKTENEQFRTERKEEEEE